MTVAVPMAAGQPGQRIFPRNRAMDSRLTQEEAGAMLSQLALCAGRPKVFSAMPVAGEVSDGRAN